jgi:hypothetical protein
MNKPVFIKMSLQSRAILLGILTLFFFFVVVSQTMSLDVPEEPEEPAEEPKEPVLEKPVKAEPEEPPVIREEPETPITPPIDGPKDPVIDFPEKPVISYPEEPEPLISYGDVNGDGHIGAWDAAIILKIVVGLIEPGDADYPLEPKAADVSDDGSISSLDAALVLQRNVGLISCFPADPELFCQPAPQQTFGDFSLQLPSLKAQHGDKVTVSVNLDNPTALLSGQFTLIYDVNNLKLIKVTPQVAGVLETETSSGEDVPLTLIEYQVQDWLLHFAFANAGAKIIPRTILNLEFDVIGHAPPGHEIPLDLSQVLFDESIVPNIYSGFVEMLPPKTAVLQNYPNPFNPETWIPYWLAQGNKVTIRIYDIKGHIIRTIALGNQPAGTYLTKDRAAYWNGKDSLGQMVTSGLYFYTLQAGDFIATKRMVIVR